MISFTISAYVSKNYEEQFFIRIWQPLHVNLPYLKSMAYLITAKRITQIKSLSDSKVRKFDWHWRENLRDERQGSGSPTRSPYLGGCGWVGNLRGWLPATGIKGLSLPLGWKVATWFIFTSIRVFSLWHFHDVSTSKTLDGRNPRNLRRFGMNSIFVALVLRARGWVDQVSSLTHERWRICYRRARSIRDVIRRPSIVYSEGYKLWVVV